MNRLPAKIIAVLLHPLLMPLYAVWILFNTGSYFNYIISATVQHFIYTIIFVTTFLMPALSSWLMVRKGKIASLEMQNREERNIPFLFTMISYATCIFLLYKLPISRMIIVFVVGGGLLLFFAFLVNLRWKISIHMLGIGGLMGMAFGFAWIFQLHMVNVLMLMAVLAGALGTARLILKAHSPAQVYTGFMSGFMIESGYFFMVFHNVHTH